MEAVQPASGTPAQLPKRLRFGREREGRSPSQRKGRVGGQSPRRGGNCLSAVADGAPPAVPPRPPRSGSRARPCRDDQPASAAPPSTCAGTVARGALENFAPPTIQVNQDPNLAPRLQ